jgi:hypothetical protein
MRIYRIIQTDLSMMRKFRVLSTKSEVSSELNQLFNLWHSHLLGRKLSSPLEESNLVHLTAFVDIRLKTSVSNFFGYLGNVKHDFLHSEIVIIIGQEGHDSIEFVPIINQNVDFTESNDKLISKFSLDKMHPTQELQNHFLGYHRSNTALNKVFKQM